MWKHSYSRSDECQGQSYPVEHLATFRLGREFGVQCPQDGVKKLRQIENSTQVWAQKLTLRLCRDAIVLTDENGGTTESFLKHLIEEPYFQKNVSSGRQSDNVSDENLLILTVREPNVPTKSENQPVENGAGFSAEMHIFRVPRYRVDELNETLKRYLSGAPQNGSQQQSRRSADGSRVVPVARQQARPAKVNLTSGAPERWSRRSRHAVQHHVEQRQLDQLQPPPPTATPKHRRALHNLSRSCADFSLGTAFDGDVNTLNCYIDDVERFVARVQAAYAAQRQLQSQTLSPGRRPLIAQWPVEAEFVDALTKFKYCFNMLGKLQDNISEPDAPDLVRYLFPPLLVVLDTARWALGKDLAPQISYPSLTSDATLLLQRSLAHRHYETWLAMGAAWRNDNAILETGTIKRPAQQHATLNRWDKSLHHGFSTPDVERHKSAGDAELESDHLAERERILLEKEAALTRFEKKLNYDRESLRDAFERMSLDRHPRETQHRSSHHQRSLSSHNRAGGFLETPSSNIGNQQQSFFDMLLKNRCPRIGFVTHDRIGQNPKELSVIKDDYLEVLDDSRNWWHCRDASNRIGYVPNTILNLVSATPRRGGDLARLQKPITVAVPPQSSTTTSYDQPQMKNVRDRNIEEHTLKFNGNNGTRY